MRIPDKEFVYTFLMYRKGARFAGHEFPNMFMCQGENRMISQNTVCSRLPELKKDMRIWGEWRVRPGCQRVMEWWIPATNREWEEIKAREMEKANGQLMLV